MRLRAQRVIAVVAVLLADGASELRAQLPGEVRTSYEATPRWRQKCKRIERDFLRGRNAEHWQASLSEVRFCDLTGANTLASAWRRASDSALAQDLLLATNRYRDARVFAALLDVSQDETAPRWPRHFAMHALIRYLDPHRHIDSRAIDPDAEEQASRSSYSSHSSMSDGPLPIPDTAARTVARTLLGVAPRTRDPVVRTTARMLGTVARADAVKGGAPDSIAQTFVDALPKSTSPDCWRVFIGLVPARRSPRWDQSIGEVTRCPFFGVEGLRRAWKGVPEDSATLADLVDASAKFPDGRLFGALDSAASDTSARWRRRTGALEVLSAYLVPRKPQAEPWQTLPPDFKPRTRALIRRISREDQDPRVRATAQEIERRLRWRW